MRSVLVRLFSIFLALIIALPAMAAGASLPTSPDYVPMPPGDFTLYRSDHFDIYYDSTRITDVSDAVVGAEAAYQAVAGFFGPYDYRIRLILAANHAQYGSILNNYMSSYNLSDSDVAGNWGDGERGTVVIEAPGQISDFSAILAHELAHVALRTKLVSNKYTVPIWFSEGLAIYVSGDLSGSAQAAVEEACREGKLMTVAQMEDVLQRSGDSSTNTDEASLAYAQSGMLMEYIATKYSNDTILLVMQDFAPIGDMDKAFMRRLGYTPEDINADWEVTLKGKLSASDTRALWQQVYGVVRDAGGKPVANGTLVFTSNDSTASRKTYTAMTNDTGYYRLNLTSGYFDVSLEKPGYAGLDANITLQNGEVRQYNVTLTGATSTQAIPAGPGTGGDQAVYLVLGILNAAAIIVIAYVFWRARK